VNTQTRENEMTNKTKLAEAIKNISFDGWGEYGVHDGFFNAKTSIDGIVYYFQCCCGDEEAPDFDDCGHNWGICGDLNKALASALIEDDDDLSGGYNSVLVILEEAYKAYNK